MNKFFFFLYFIFIFLMDGSKKNKKKRFAGNNWYMYEWYFFLMEFEVEEGDRGGVFFFLFLISFLFRFLDLGLRGEKKKKKLLFEECTERERSGKSEFDSTALQLAGWLAGWNIHLSISSIYIKLEKERATNRYNASYTFRAGAYFR